MALLTLSSPHTINNHSTQGLMLQVCIATIPGMMALTYLFGWGSLIQVFLCIVLALCCEAIILKLRNNPVLFFLKDCSEIVTGLLLGLSIPPIAPWWISVIGISFAIIIGKQLYGGLGFNPFNPAMLGYVLLLISFPVEMTSWLAPQSLNSNNEANLLTTLQTIFLQEAPSTGIDSFTMATPLDSLKTLARQTTEANQALAQMPQFIQHGGILFADAWYLVNLSFLAGGLVLLYRGVVGWHTPAGIFIGLGACALIGYLINPQLGNPFFHLLSGATCFAAFFIATDPVSSPTSNRGRLVYGVAIGAIVFIIRAKGGYPDAFAFAVLLLNLAAPTIDHYTRPRVYGHKGATKGLKQGTLK